VKTKALRIRQRVRVTFTTARYAVTQNTVRNGINRRPFSRLSEYRAIYLLPHPALFDENIVVRSNIVYQSNNRPYAKSAVGRNLRVDDDKRRKRLYVLTFSKGLDDNSLYADASAPSVTTTVTCRRVTTKHKHESVLYGCGQKRRTERIWSRRILTNVRRGPSSVNVRTLYCSSVAYLDLNYWGGWLIFK